MSLRGLQFLLGIVKLLLDILVGLKAIYLPAILMTWICTNIGRSSIVPHTGGMQRVEAAIEMCKAEARL